MKNKRIIAMILCAMMVFSLLPAAVFADGAEEEIVDVFFGGEEEETLPAEETVQDEELPEEEEDEIIPEEEAEFLPIEDETISEEDEINENEELPEEPETDEDGNEFEVVTTIASGAAGPNATYELVRDSLTRKLTLTIEGTGAMYNSVKHGWSDYAGSIDIVNVYGVSTIGDYAFDGFSFLDTLYLEAPITSIGESAFSGCVKLGDIEIPDSVTSIGALAFEGCTGLYSIWFWGNAPAISSTAFTGVTSTVRYPLFDDTYRGKHMNYGGKLTWEYWYGDIGGKCGDYVRWRLEGFDTLIIESTTAVAADTWDFGLNYPGWIAYAEGITNVQLNNISRIGEDTFDYCSKLAKITIPASVKSIGDNAFFECKSLKEITFLGNAPAIDTHAFNGITATAYVPKDNSTWTNAVMQNYAGKITWVKPGSHAAPVLQTPANHENFMIIQWSKCEGATGYRLQYREGSGPWTEVKVALTQVNSKGEPRWDYKGAKDGATYTFRVFADFADGTYTESNRMGQMRLRTPKITVKHFGGSDTTGGFRIDWQATTGGSQYKIYYREKGGSWALYTMMPKSANTTFLNIKASITNANSNMPNLVAGHTYEFMVLTCTTVASVTSGYPTPFVSMKF